MATELKISRFSEPGCSARADQSAAATLEELKRRARRERQEDLLDEAVEETFPASDPVSVAIVI